MTEQIDLYWSFRSPYSYLAVKPTFVLNRQPFFGQGRIDVLAGRLGKMGVSRR